MYPDREAIGKGCEMYGPFEMQVVIGSSDCDALGHMNVSRYFALCNQAGFAMQTAIGWPPGAENAGRRYSFAVVHSESDFLAEVHAGEALVVQTGIAEIGNKTADFDNRIARKDGTPVFRSVWKSVLMDLDTRRAVIIPEDLRFSLMRRSIV